MNKPASRHLPPLAALKAFEAVARHGQLAAAADELCVTTSAVSRQLKALEEHLGIALFNRDRRAIELSSAGRAYANDLRRIFNELHESTDSVVRLGERGTLHVRTSMPSFVQRWLMPRLGGFQERHPAVDIQITSVDDLADTDFDRHLLDIGLTRQPRSDGEWRSVELMRELLVVVCSPDLPARTRLDSLADLKHHRTITTLSRPELWDRYCESAGLGNVRSTGETQLAHFYMTLEAALSGVGVTVMPLPLVLEELDSGRLVAPLKETRPSGERYYAIYREIPERTATGKPAGEPEEKRSTLVFIEWLQDEAGRQPATC